ncbi:MAG: dihydroorotate dehydrogenase electron transfer subunit [Deltaproteobacteria bacterium]|nr:dihydroorotate dehydrogenase electron transfer subunit [Deltaproteobacteria bacterium]
MALQTDGIVLNNRKIKSIYFLLEIDCPAIANEAKPGQFVMISTSDNHHPLLRRPFSIYKSYSTLHPSKEKRGQLSILYKKVGKGTQKMSTFKEGQKVNLIGPLGNGFILPPLPSPAATILIGGGVGMASLSALGEALCSEKIYVFIGGKTKDDILCEDDFPKGKVFIATEDGSLGKKGTVVDLFLSEIERFDRGRPHHVYICGPEGMVKSLSKALKSKKWIIQVSLEARMGCGFGACWGCVVKTRDTEMAYRRVCKDGPVFPLSEIVWESS